MNPGIDWAGKDPPVRWKDTFFSHIWRSLWNDICAAVMQTVFKCGLWRMQPLNWDTSCTFNPSFGRIYQFKVKKKQSFYLCMLGHWLSTGRCGHSVCGRLHWAHSPRHTWPHRWSCSCKMRGGGCSSFDLHWCWCGSELDTVQLQEAVKIIF